MNDQNQNHESLGMAVSHLTFMDEDCQKVSFSRKSARILAIGAIIGISLIGPASHAQAISPSASDTMISEKSFDDLPSWVSLNIVCVEEYCAPQYSASCVFSHTKCVGVWCKANYSAE